MSTITEARLIGRATTATIWRDLLNDFNQDHFKGQLPEYQLAQWRKDYPMVRVDWMAPNDKKALIKFIQNYLKSSQAYDEHQFTVTQTAGGRALSLRLVPIQQEEQQRPISMRKERYVRRYEANSCGGARPKKETDTPPAAEPKFDPLKQEGFSASAFSNFLASMELLDPSVKPVLRQAIESIAHFGATTSRKKFEQTLAPLMQRLDKWFTHGV